jgi:thymidylate kinase
VRKGYLELARIYPERIKVYSADKEKRENIQRFIEKAVSYVIARYSK